ncbi:hypothetical protein KCP74_18315 [Salmonella enterica subsp. enterica]|nr:hypothetical protein KCP74_18315 [Salmonella enterica subsp. enterica]
MLAESILQGGYLLKQFLTASSTGVTLVSIFISSPVLFDFANASSTPSVHRPD